MAKAEGVRRFFSLIVFFKIMGKENLLFGLEFFLRRNIALERLKVGYSLRVGRIVSF